MSDHHTTIPATIDDVTTDWLNTVLAQSGDGTITDFSAEPLGVGVGLIGLLYKLNLTWDGTGPDAVVLKLASQDEGSLMVAGVLNMYGREVNFYKHLAGDTKAKTTHVHHAHHDAENNRFALILDFASGTTVVQIAGATREQAEVAVDALADLHADHWMEDRIHSAEWLPRLNTPPIPQAIEMSYQAGWPAASELYDDLMDDRLREFCANYDKHLPMMTDTLSADPVTLSHGDFRGDNMFFDGDEVTLIDFQLVDRSRGGRDLAYFTTQTLDPELRAEIEMDLVRRYCDRLATDGVADYPFEQAWEDYRLGTAFAIIYPIVAGGQCDQSDERARHLTRSMFERGARAIRDLNALETVGL